MNGQTTGQLFFDPANATQIADDCWTLLQHAVFDRDCGWRLPVLATWDGTNLRQRTLVLRRVDSATRRLYFHTNLHSPKVRILTEHPNVSLNFYDAQHQVQLQVIGQGCVHQDDDIRDDFWQSEPESSLRAYLAPLPPGTVCSDATANLPENVQGRIPDRNEVQPGKTNFAVISVQIHSAEFLILRESGHTRGRWTFSDQQSPTFDWLAP